MLWFDYLQRFTAHILPEGMELILTSGKNLITIPIGLILAEQQTIIFRQQQILCTKQPGSAGLYTVAHFLPMPVARFK